MVVVVDPRSVGVEFGGWDPFDEAVFAQADGPAGVGVAFGHPVMARTGLGHGIDVGLSHTAPGVAVVDLAPVPGWCRWGTCTPDRGRRARSAAPDSRCAGCVPGTGDVGVAVEHREVVIGLAGFADHIRHGQDGAPGGDAPPVASVKSCRVVVMTMVAGRPLKFAEAAGRRGRHVRRPVARRGCAAPHCVCHHRSVRPTGSPQRRDPSGWGRTCRGRRVWRRSLRRWPATAG